MTVRNKCIQHNLICVNEITIREARREDIPSIVETSWASTTEEEMVGFTAPEWGTFRDAEKLRNEWIKENKLRDDYEVIVAERTGQIIGYLVFKREKDFLYIDLIHIRKSQRGKGFGRALVEHIERLAIEGGQTRIETETTENAQGMPWQSYGFWLGVGFSDTGDRVATKWDFKLIPFVKLLS